MNTNMTGEMFVSDQGTVSLNHLGGKTGILCTEKRAPKSLVKRPPGLLIEGHTLHALIVSPIVTPYVKEY
jgi:hypothetical protein